MNSARTVPDGKPRQWLRHWVGKVSDPKFAETAMAAETSRSVALAVWDCVLESAAYVNDGRGTFDVPARRIAATLGEPVGVIEKVLAAMIEIGMIAESRVAKWHRRQFAVDERDKSGGKTRGDSADADPAESAAQNPATTAANLSGAVAAPSESESESDKESSSVVVPFAARAAAPPEPTDDDEILIGMISKALAGKAEAKVVRAGIGPIRGWVHDGCDLERDVLPELAEIGRKLTTPLRTLAAKEWRLQVFARRDGRLAAQNARGGAPPLPIADVFVAIGTPQWAAHVAHGHKPGLKTTRTVDGRRRNGWHFASEWPPGHDARKTAGGKPP